MQARQVKVDWTTPDRGVLTLRCSSESEVDAYVRMLRKERPPIVFDGRGDAMCIRLSEDAAEPDLSDLPGDITLSVRRADAPPLSPRWLMRLASNLVQQSMHVRVVTISWDDEALPRRCVLRLLIDSPEEYGKIRSLVDHPRGAALLTPEGERFYLTRVRDTANPSGRFPQVFDLDLSEVPAEYHLPQPGPPPYTTDEIVRWLVPIVPRHDLAQDLTALEAALDAGTRLEYRHGNPYLTSERFNSAGTIDEALDVARKLITTINAAASLSAATDTNYRQIELGPKAIVVLSDGRELEHPEPPSGLRVTVLGGGTDSPWARDWSDSVRRAAVRHGDKREVADVLRLWMTRPHTWAALYVIVETIEHEAGASVATLGWVTPKQRDLFRRTANTLPPDKDLPRHGGRHRPPPSPMTIGAASAMVRNVITAWLTSMPSDETAEHQA